MSHGLTKSNQGMGVGYDPAFPDSIEVITTCEIGSLVEFIDRSAIKPDQSGDPLFIVLQHNATKSDCVNLIKSPQRPGFYGHPSGVSASTPDVIDREIRPSCGGHPHASRSNPAADEMCDGNQADRVVPVGKSFLSLGRARARAIAPSIARAFSSIRRGLSSVSTRLPCILTMQGFFANVSSWFALAIGKPIAGAFAGSDVPARLSSTTGSLTGKPASESYEQGRSLSTGWLFDATGQSNPPVTGSHPVAGFYLWDGASLAISDPVAGALHKDQAAAAPAIFSYSTRLVRDVAMLVAFLLLLLVLAGIMGCQSSRADGNLPIGQAKGLSESIDATFDSIRQSAEAAKKEIGR